MDICRQCFREKAQDIGFYKVGFPDMPQSRNTMARIKPTILSEDWLAEEERIANRIIFVKQYR
jgi:hypothetical protein